MPPRSRPPVFRSSPKPSPVVNTGPLEAAYQQERGAVQKNDSEAQYQDLIKQEADANAQAAKAQEQAQRQQLAAAKKAGVQTRVDETGVESMERHPDGKPVYTAGFQGGAKPVKRDDGTESTAFAYRDPRGTEHQIDAAGVRRKPAAGGGYEYEFEIGTEGGQKRKVRQLEESSNPLFKIDEKTGNRLVDTVDPVTGSVTSKAIGIDPEAAAKATIEKQKQAWETRKAELTFQEQTVRQQKSIDDLTLQPIKEKLTEAEKSLKDMMSKRRYEQRDGKLMAIEKIGEEDFPSEVMDESEKINATKWLESKASLDKQLATIKAEHDPLEAKVSAAELQSRKLALQATQEAHAALVRERELIKQADAGAPIWESDFQKRLENAQRDPRYTSAIIEGQLADEANPLLDAPKFPELPATNRLMVDLLKNTPAAYKPGVPFRPTQPGEEPLDGLGSTLRLNQLLERMPTARTLPDGTKDVTEAAKAFGTLDPTAYHVAADQDGNGAPIVKTETGITLARVAPDGQSLRIEPDALKTEDGRALVFRADPTMAPVYAKGDAQPFTPQEKRDYFNAAISTATMGDEAAMSTVGVDIPGIRKQFKDGKLSAQDANFLLKEIHGVDAKSMTAADAHKELATYVGSSQIESALWSGPNANPVTRKEVVDRFMDNYATQAQSSLVYDGKRLEELRGELRNEFAKPSNVLVRNAKGLASTLTGGLYDAPEASFLEDTPKMLAGSVIGLAGNVIATSAESVWHALTLGNSDLSDRFELFEEGSGEWFKNASGFARRLRTGPALDSELNALKEWADNAAPGETPPANLAESMARTTFGAYHGLTTDGQNAADANTTEDTFNPTKDPILSQRLNRYLNTRSPEDWESFADMLSHDGKSRALADRVQKYITKPRVANAEEVAERAAKTGITLSPEKSAALLALAAKKPATKAEYDATVKQAETITGLKGKDAELAMDLWAKEESVDPTSLEGYVRGGLQAPIQEIGTEAISWALGAGLGKVAAGGIKGAVKGTVAATRKASTAGYFASKAANLVDDFERMGMFKAKFGTPLTKGQRFSNAAVSLGKAATIQAADEFAQEGIMAVGEPGSGLKDVAEAGAAGAAAGLLMVGGTTALALPSSFRADARASKAYELGKTAQLEKLNAHLRSIPGSKPLTADDYDAVLAVYGGTEATQHATEVNAAKQELDAANAVLAEAMATPEGRAIAQQANVKKRSQELKLRQAELDQQFGPRQDAQGNQRALTAEEQQIDTDLAQLQTAATGPTPTRTDAIRDARRQVHEAKRKFYPVLSQIVKRETQAVNAVAELQQLPAAQRTLYTAVAKARLGQTEYTQAEADALNRLVGSQPTSGPPQPIRWAVAPSATAVRDKGLPDIATTLPQNRLRIAQGSAPIIPDELLTEIANNAPILGEMLATSTVREAQAQQQIAAQQTVDQDNTAAVLQSVEAFKTANPGLAARIQPGTFAEGASGMAFDPSTGIISYDVERVVEDLGRLAESGPLTPEKRTARIETLLNEEVVHLADEVAAANIFAQLTGGLDPTTTFAQALKSDQVDAIDSALGADSPFSDAYAKLSADLEKNSPGFQKPTTIFGAWKEAYYARLASEFTPEQTAMIREAYGPTYDQLPSQYKVREGVRMLSQVSASKFGRITESLYRHVKALVDALKELLTNPPANIRRHLEQMDKFLAEVGIIGQKDGPAQPDLPNQTNPGSMATDATKTPKSSTQFTLKPEDAAPILAFGKTIPQDELSPEVIAEDGTALEDAPHVTVLYGLTKHDAAPVQKAIADHGPVTIKLGNLSVFENDKYDVLKVDIEGDSLRSLNAKISKLPNENTFPDYKPHMTVAYLKKGEGAKYVGDSRFAGKTITFDSLTFSPPKDLRAEIGTPELPLQNLDPIAIRVSVEGKSQSRSIAFQSLNDREAFQAHQALQRLDQKNTPETLKTAADLVRKVQTRLNQDGNLATVEQTESMIAEYGGRVETASIAHKARTTPFNAPTMESVLRFKKKDDSTALKRVAADRLKDTTGTDIISRFKSEYGPRLPAPSKDASWDDYWSIVRDAENQAKMPGAKTRKEVEAQARRGEIDDARSMLEWLNQNIISQDGEGSALGEVEDTLGLDPGTLFGKILEAIAVRTKIATGEIAETIDDQAEQMGNEAIKEESDQTERRKLFLDALPKAPTNTTVTGQELFKQVREGQSVTVNGIEFTVRTKDIDIDDETYPQILVLSSEATGPWQITEGDLIPSPDLGAVQQVSPEPTPQPRVEPKPAPKPEAEPAAKTAAPAVKRETREALNAKKTEGSEAPLNPRVANFDSLFDTLDTNPLVAVQKNLPGITTPATNAADKALVERAAVLAGKNSGPPGVIPPFQGNKRDMILHAFPAILRYWTAEQRGQITELYDMFAGGGAWGLLTANQLFPNVKTIHVNEFDPIRATKVRWQIERGDRFAKSILEKQTQDALQAWLDIHYSRSQGNSWSSIKKSLREIIETNRDTLSPDAFGALVMMVDDPSLSTPWDNEDTKASAEDVTKWALSRHAISAREIYKTAQQMRDRGVEFKFYNGDAYALSVTPGPQTFVLADPPYIFTLGYKGDDIVGNDIYTKTADLMERLVGQENHIAYTDEAWWIKPDLSDVVSDGAMADAAKTTERIANTIDLTVVADLIGNRRYETLGLYNPLGSPIANPLAPKRSSDRNQPDSQNPDGRGIRQGYGPDGLDAEGAMAAATVDQARLQSSGDGEVGPPITHTFPDGYVLTEQGNQTLPAAPVAYHGTPHKVDKFRLDRIGTGEGNQVYGWGLYFAEQKEVAEKYQKELGARGWKLVAEYPSVTAEAAYKAKGTLGYKGSKALAKKEIEAELRDGIITKEVADEALYLIDTAEGGGGNLYTVKLLPDESEFLEWHAPLKEQSPKVQQVLKDYIPQSQSALRERKDLDDFEGQRIYTWIGNGQSAARSETLLKLGIPGIKYVDAGSRNMMQPVPVGKKWNATANGKSIDFDTWEEAVAYTDSQKSYNYVIFDENLIEILEENGQPVSQNNQQSLPAAPVTFVEPGFYSALNEAIKNKMPARQTAAKIKTAFDAVFPHVDLKDRGDQISVLAGDTRWDKYGNNIKTIPGGDDYTGVALRVYADDTPFVRIDEMNVATDKRGKGLGIKMLEAIQKGGVPVYHSMDMSDGFWEHVKATRPELFNRSMPAAPARAYESMTFDPPFETPIGEILSYHWMSRPQGQFQVSDWSQSRTNPRTGRPIVHHFKVKDDAGEVSTVSLETAMGKLSDTDRTKLTRQIKAEQQRREDEQNGQGMLFAAPVTPPEPTAADYRNRNKEPGVDYRLPPNSIAIQLRGLNTEPIGDGKPIVLPFNGDLRSAGAAIDSGMTRTVEDSDASFRESPIKVTDENGRAIYSLRYNPIERTVEATEQSQLERRRAETRAANALKDADPEYQAAMARTMARIAERDRQDRLDRLPPIRRGEDEQLRLFAAPATPPESTEAFERALKEMPPMWANVLQQSMRGESIPSMARRMDLSEVAISNILRNAQGRLSAIMKASEGNLKPRVRKDTDGAMKYTGGRPDLAFGANPNYNAIDRERSTPLLVTRSEMNEAAHRLFEANPEQAEKLVTHYLDTQNINDIGMDDSIQKIVADATGRDAKLMLMDAAAQLLITRKSFQGGDPVQVARLVHLIDSRRATRTDLARALGMGVDPHMTPAERHAMVISSALHSPPQSIQLDIEKNPANRETLLARWAAKSQKIKQALQARGIDIDATFAHYNAEWQAARDTLPESIREPLAREERADQVLVRSIMEGETPTEAAARAGLTLNDAQARYRGLWTRIATSLKAIKNQMLPAAPATDPTNPLPSPDLFDTPDQPAVDNAKTQKLKRLRARPRPGNVINLEDEVDTAAKLQIIGTEKSSLLDAIIEYRRASILTGPQTHIVNTVSALTYGTYEATLKKLGSAALADLARLFGMKPDAASLADLPAMAAALVPSVRAAYADAIRAWKANTRVFEAHAKAESLTDKRDRRDIDITPAMRGVIGKVMNFFSFRAMLLADQFMVSLFSRLEVAAQARQIARSEGLAGQKMANRISELLVPGSEAWQRGLEQGQKITFQTPMQSGKRAIDSIDGIAKMITSANNGDYGKTIKVLTSIVFPFVSTPTNIFKQGMTMAPTGLFLGLIDAARALDQKRQGNTQAAKELYGAARALDDAINQTVAWGTMLALYGLIAPDEDDPNDLPYVTGTLPWRATSKGERDIAYRTAPPQSVRIGGQWYSYRRLDPFATALAFVVDSMTELRKTGSVSQALPKVGVNILNNMQDKTFMTGISDIMNAIQNPDRYGQKWATNVVTGFVPNLIRQPLRNTDDVLRDTDLPNDMGFSEVLATRIGASIYAPAFLPPKVDLWGRPLKKNTGTGTPETDVLYRILTPVDTQDSEAPDPLDVSLQRWNMNNPDEAFAAVPPARDVKRTINGEQKVVSLNDAAYNRMLTAAGQKARAAIGNRYSGRDLTIDDVETIKKVVQQYQSQERERAFRENYKPPATPPATSALARAEN